MGATVNDFPLFLTSSKQPLDAFFDLGYFAVCTVLLRISEELQWQHGTTHILTKILHAIIIIFHKVDVPGPLLGRDPLVVDISCK